MNRLTFALFIVLFFISCGTSRRAATELPEISISAKDPKAIFRESAPRLWDITNTRVALSFHWRERTANGRVWIDMHPYFYAQDSIVLDAKGMRIDSVTQLVNGAQKTLNYSYAGNKLSIRLDKKYQAGDVVSLYIKYLAMPYAENAGGSVAISEDRGLYFINTNGAIPNKPQQLWTQGETESNSQWLPTIDKPNERFTVQLELTVPDTMQTLSNGRKTGSESIGNGLKVDGWAMDMPIQPYAVMFAVGEFAIVRDKWKDKEVCYYVEREYEPYARKMFRNTPEMIGFFSDVTGVPYPWQKYDQVVVRDYVSGAMENTTASLFGEFMNQDARENADKDYEDIVSHELFHQWFGDYVTQESWSNLTLSESFATYGEQLWRKYKYGKESADKLAYEDLHIYLDGGIHAPELVRFHYTDREDMFDRISYQKGCAILRYLHELIGDAAFYKAMKLYLTKNALKPAEAAQWRLAVEEATGQDWNWFFNQFYYHGDHPILDVKYEYNDALKVVTVHVSQQSKDNFIYRLPLKTALVYNGERRDVDWLVDEKQEVFVHSYKDGVKPVIVPDITHLLPGVIKESKGMDDWLQQIKLSNDYVAKRVAIEKAVKNKNDETARKIIDAALEDTSRLVRAFVLENMNEFRAEVFGSRWGSVVKRLALEDPSSHVRAGAMEMAGNWRLKEFKAEMLKSIDDSSYKVAGASLNALAGIDDDTALLIARRVLENDPRAELQQEAEVLVAVNGDSKDFSYFEQKADYVYGSRKMAFATVLTFYLHATNDLAIFDKGLDLLVKMVKNESIKSYRNYVAQTTIYMADKYKKKDLNSEIKRNKIKKRAEELISFEADPSNKAEYQRAYATAFSVKR